MIDAMAGAATAAKERVAQPDEVVLPLRKNFQFTHEPLLDSDDERFAARHAEVEALTARILNARGGAYLVTGYRGVGKTTFVNQVIGRIRKTLQSLPGTAGSGEHHQILLDIAINLPVETRADRLMHLIVRRLYERLSELGVLHKIDPNLRRDIELAYTRTSFKLSQKRTQALDLSLGNSLEWEALGVKLGFKSPISAKRSRSSVHEASFLAYDERTAEADIVNLGRRLTACTFSDPKTLLSRIRERWTKQPSQTFSLRIVFIFDELDKLEYAHDESRPVAQACLPVERHLRNLKSLFTTSGFSFIFVAGRDMHDHWLREAATGDSVFESVFSWDCYVPCLWEETRQICDRVVDFRSLAVRQCSDCRRNFDEGNLLCSICGKYLRDRRAAFEAYERFLKYLCFRGRGLTRLVLRSLHNWVQIRDGRAYLVFSKRDLRRHRAFADLWDRLLAAEDRDRYDSVFGPRSNLLDRNRLACLYFFDWLLQTGNRVFTLTEAEKAVALFSAKIAPEQGVSPMLESAVKVGLIEILPDEPDQAKVGAQQPRYTLASRWRIDIGQVVDEEAGPGPAAPGMRRAGNYRIDRLLVTGGMSEVHLGFDLATRRTVALKLLVSYDDTAHTRFRQEIALLSSSRHPNIVRYLGEGSFEERPFFAMDFIEGEELKAILAKCRALSPAVALYIAYSTLR